MDDEPKHVLRYASGEVILPGDSVLYDGSLVGWVELIVDGADAADWSDRGPVSCST